MLWLAGGWLKGGGMGISEVTTRGLELGSKRQPSGSLSVWVTLGKGRTVPTTH